jgi:hypothetical protein
MILSSIALLKVVCPIENCNLVDLFWFFEHAGYVFDLPQKINSAEKALELSYEWRV